MLSAKKETANAVSFPYIGFAGDLLSQSLIRLSHFLEDASVLLGNDGTDDQQSGNHQHHSDSQVDDHILDQTGQDEADEGHTGHGQGIGDLGEHVV